MDHDNRKTVLVTGSCGFIFSNFIQKALKDWQRYRFVSIDKVVAPYNIFNVNDSHRFYMGDVADEHFVNFVFCKEKPDYVIHGAAESFVDDSIMNAQNFVHSNVLGTQVMIDAAVKHRVQRFVYISTDEVFGQLKIGEQSWNEDSAISPRNPYSASKAAGELIVRAAHETHGLQYNVTRSCNNFGPRQPPRNLVPKTITCVATGNKIPIHGRGVNIREWLHVEDHCSAVMKVMEEGKANETYCIGSGIEMTNIEMVETITDYLGKGKDLISFITDRKGHDYRYSVDSSKIRKLGWSPKYSFQKNIESTIDWYLQNPHYNDIMNLRW